MKIRIAVITDLHASAVPSVQAERKSELAPILLRRALAYVNIRRDVDLVVLAGDLTDKETDLEMLKGLQTITEVSTCPLVAIPGNHDPEASAFYSVFERHDYVDCKGFRVILFPDDPQIPGWNAHRTDAEQGRLRRLCEDFAGPKIVCQHVPLFPSGFRELSYVYDNADQVCSEFRGLGVVASISAHQHWGVEELYHDGTSYLCTPSLCESPFRFQIVEYDELGHAQVETHSLRMPEELAPFNVDHHTHSPVAYCNENIDPDIELKLMDALNISHIYVTEHSGQLYNPERDYWGHTWFVNPLGDLPDLGREGAFIDYMSKLPKEQFRASTELDIDASGRILATDRLLEATGDFRVGAVHALTDPSSSEAPRQFLFLCDKLASSGLIKVLAHPYRIFSWTKNRVPEETFEPLVQILKKYRVAAEINFHKNFPQPVFTKMCIENGVKISMGCDTHNLYEMGFLNPQLDFLKSLGYGLEDLGDILIR